MTFLAFEVFACFSAVLKTNTVFSKLQRWQRRGLRPHQMVRQIFMNSSFLEKILVRSKYTLHLQVFYQWLELSLCSRVHSSFFISNRKFLVYQQPDWYFLKTLSVQEYSVPVVDVGEKPNHPPSTFKFPVTKFGDQNRSCQSKWFEEFGWLHYDEARNRVFCYHCVQAVQEKKLLNTKAEDAFTKSGFFNWKKALLKFKAHQSSQCHKESVEKVSIKTVHKDIGDSLSAQHTSEKTLNRECLKKIIETLRFLSRQSIAKICRVMNSSIYFGNMSKQMLQDWVWVTRFCPENEKFLQN